MENFTPISSMIGGVLIGASAVLLFWFNGKIAGISGIFYAALDKTKTDGMWRWYFLLGLLLGGALAVWFDWASFEIRQNFSVIALCMAGFLVGFGTRMGNGCTSGHGICGLARLSPRSMVAVCIFMLSAVLTVYVIRHYLGLTL